MTAGTDAPARGDFAPLARETYALLTTYRREGAGVGTPVHLAVDGDRAYLRTWDATGKIRRIHNNPEVEVRPCTARGKAMGPAVPARARVLSGGEAAHAARLLSRKHPILHGVLIPFFHKLRGYTTAQVELTGRGSDSI